MSDERIVNLMIEKIEQMIREEVQEDFDTAKGAKRKVVAKLIIEKLEETLANEDKKD